MKIRLNLKTSCLDNVEVTEKKFNEEDEAKNENKSCNQTCCIGARNVKKSSAGPEKV